MARGAVTLSERLYNIQVAPKTTERIVRIIRLIALKSANETGITVLH